MRSCSFGNRLDMVEAVFDFAHHLAAGCPIFEDPFDPGLDAYGTEAALQEADRLLQAVGGLFVELREADVADVVALDA